MPAGAAVRTAMAAVLAACAALPAPGQEPPAPTPTPSPSPVTTPTPAPTPPPAASPLGADEIRARERMALIAVSTILQAEKAYAAVNGSFFDEIRCLSAPAECIPSYPADEAPFLDPGYPWLETRLGYARKFHPGPKAPAEQVARGRASPTSLTAFAFTVTPLVPGRTGGRAFCGDSSGRMCVRADGREPAVNDGRCEPCQKLQ
jgi:hypothetical protein